MAVAIGADILDGGLFEGGTGDFGGGLMFLVVSRKVIVLGMLIMRNWRWSSRGVGKMH